MKVGLIGYGKMGKAIEELALSRGHQIVLRADSSGFSEQDLMRCNIAIEFSTPHSAPDNIRRCLLYGIPVVTGTTGWYEQLGELKQLSKDTGTPMLYASNFSVGVNLFFALNRYLARMMNHQTEYDVHIREIHHTEKKDTPSGTAITLAEGILAELERKKQWFCQMADNSGMSHPFDIRIAAFRQDSVPGTHTIAYDSEIDSIEITHTAHNRRGFALGALLAAEWLPGNKGVFTMTDVLKI